jgi:hypothetical protein
MFCVVVYMCEFFGEFRQLFCRGLHGFSQDEYSKDGPRQLSNCFGFLRSRLLCQIQCLVLNEHVYMCMASHAPCFSWQQFPHRFQINSR